ncbi:Membrane attack complex component/perforin [Metarhizium album ARSEF 1941]|uniref:Membrane attack complex component/perforin n=1 Tax=Metarhizium album (strain ARSEF 1941) TaxID=1081103 RepID=A0A0B2X365_METAS|nr:Membrane attack complex component/perforin [Metarhizium album ARSEF 1941]KHN99854.1 Membrane attack complex component/perforin [Metarhizium album ARSEF 1941]
MPLPCDKNTFLALDPSFHDNDPMVKLRRHVIDNRALNRREKSYPFCNHEGAKVNDTLSWKDYKAISNTHAGTNSTPGNETQHNDQSGTPKNENTQAKKIAAENKLEDNKETFQVFMLKISSKPDDVSKDVLNEKLNAKLDTILHIPISPSGGRNFVSYTFPQFPRVVVYLNKDDVDVTAECKAELQSIAQDDKGNAKRVDSKTLEEFLNKFGHFIPMRVELGGRLHSSESLGEESTAQSVQKANALKVAASLSFSSPFVHARLARATRLPQAKHIRRQAAT